MTEDTEQIQEFTAQEKAAKITYNLVNGQEMTTAEIAKETGITWHGADAMMKRISRVVPIYRADGRWRM